MDARRLPARERVDVRDARARLIVAALPAPGETLRLAPEEAGHRRTSAVDGDDVPVRHFGVVLSMDEWNALAARLRNEGTKFIIEPHIRFKGEVGEQATMFFLDPCGNALEFKAFADPSRLFAK